MGPGGVVIAPSILSADFGALDAAVDTVAGAGDWIHVDVMDGHFVPNLTIGPPVVAALRRHGPGFLDCHLMMTDPGAYLDAFKEAGADSCTVHVEVGDSRSLLTQVRALGMYAGLALNPDTPFGEVEPYLDMADLLLVMTVQPGFGGQSFRRDVLPKVAEASREIGRRGLATVIEVDGGIDASTAAETSAAGARAFVSGSAIFGTDDPAEACRSIRTAATRAAAPLAP